jgi:hypothetical protein
MCSGTACNTTTNGGLCNGCSMSCNTCCAGDNCASQTAVQDSAYPLCAANLTSPACEMCDMTRSTQCHPTTRNCSCGDDRQCGNGELCVADGGTDDHCECDPMTCTGCCEQLGNGRSRCVGSISLSACAVAPTAGMPVGNCVSCVDAGSSGDCDNGVCKCGAGGPCAAGLRCFKDACVQ